MSGIFDLLGKLKSYFFPKDEPTQTFAPSLASEPSEPYETPVYSNEFSCEMDLMTDTAILTLFDPEAIPDKSEHEYGNEWWMFDFNELPELRKGIMAIVRTGADGVFHVRITNQNLTDEEQLYAAWSTPDLGAKITSGKLYVGVGEEIPGGEYEFEERPDRLSTNGGGFILLPNGDYTIRFFGLETDELSDEPTLENKELLIKLPEIVIQLLPGKAKVPKLKEEPSLFVEDSKFLFRSKKQAPLQTAKEQTAAKKIKAVDEKRAPARTDTPVTGMTIVFTGKLTKFTRPQAKATAEDLGASVASSVSANTDYLVVGEKPGSKLQEAQKLGVKVISEDEWLNLTKE